MKLRDLIRLPWGGEKTFRAMRHPAGQSTLLMGLLKRTRFDYRKEIGNGLDSSVVTAPVMWLQRALPEARLAVRQRRRNGTVKDQVEHPMLALIQRPNAFYGDIALWGATILSWAIAGNAYWLILRNRGGKPAELWYVPHWMIEPRATAAYAADEGGAFIDHYLYSPGGGEQFRLDVEDVIHFRNGLDPRNLRKGLSPLDGVIREIFADLESSNFVASLLRNMGVPGVVISPKSGAIVANEDVDATKSWFKQAFGGDNRGGPLVMGAPTDVQPYGFNPQQMNLSEARDVAEERVCACLGVPAAVVGFGAGLQQTKVGATMKELRQLAWHNGVLPMGRQFADELQRSLLPLFAQAVRPEQLEVFWDTDNVPALQEDEDKQIERKLKELAAGAITLFDYRSETGREADDSHKIYLRPIALLEVPEGQLGKATELPGEPAMLPAPAKGVKDKSALRQDEDGRDRATPEELKRGEAYALMLQRQAKGLSAAFEKALLPLFRGWGAEAAAAARKVLTGEKSARPAARPPETKSADDDYAARIAALLDNEAWRIALEQAYGAHYLEVAKAVTGAAEQAGLGTGLPDPAMVAIVATGGKRAGLIDLDAQTRQAIFDALAEGRAEGEGVAALAARIAHQVEGGVWNEAEYRARLIARTETKFAQNISTIATGKAAGVDRFMVFDGRLGPGRSKPDHMARNGSIVTAEEAVAMAEAEHPNGTLSFAPHFNLED